MLSSKLATEADSKENAQRSIHGLTMLQIRQIQLGTCTSDHKRELLFNIQPKRFIYMYMRISYTYTIADHCSDVHVWGEIFLQYVSYSTCV